MVKLVKADIIKNNDIKKLYLNSFPKKERRNILHLKLLNLLKKEEIYSINDDELTVGLMFIHYYKDIVLLDYFAVFGELRNKKYGSSALTALKEVYSDKNIILEADMPNPSASDNEIRNRRIVFYKRNGFIDLGINMEAFGCPFTILSTKQQAITLDIYKDIYYNIYHSRKFIEKNIFEI